MKIEMLTLFVVYEVRTSVWVGVCGDLGDVTTHRYVEGEGDEWVVWYTLSTVAGVAQ